MPFAIRSRLASAWQTWRVSPSTVTQQPAPKYHTKGCSRSFADSPGARTLVFVRSGKLQNESFPNFSNFRPEFCPEFCSEFSPNFSRTFRASFRGRRRPEKIHQKSPPFFNAKFPGKNEKNTQKILLESKQSKFLQHLSHVIAVNFGRQ